jgi:hypothetical protein
MHDFMISMVTGLALFYLLATGLLAWIAASSSFSASNGEDSYRPKPIQKTQAQGQQQY